MTPRATVVGSGPNGLVAAVSLARAGYDVRVLEAASRPGGGIRSEAITVDGFVHDLASAVHPLAATSAWFRAFGLADRIEWLVPEASYAHPLEDGPAAVAWRDLDRTTDELGEDGRAWRWMLEPLAADLDSVLAVTGGSILSAPRHPRALARLGVRVAATGLAGPPLRTVHARALWAGVVAHAPARQPSLAGAATGLLLAAHAHTATGWPVPRGGAGSIADALLADLRAHGGVVETGVTVRDLAQLDRGDPAAGDVLLLAGAPRLAATLPGVPAAYARAVRGYRYGPAVAKVDLALSQPVPWRDPRVSSSPTVHLGGTSAQIAAAERAVLNGRLAHDPYVLLVQPSVVDDTRAPQGGATVWAYLHVPLGSTVDPTDLVLRRIERFAPGVRDLVVGRHVARAVDLAASNPAAIGGDGLGGSLSLTQLARRPVWSTAPWRTPVPGVYLASAATAPGPGVHGMAGWHAARTVLHDAGRPTGLGDLFDRSRLRE